MNFVFYISGSVAVIATLMAITRANAVHALLYLIVSLLSVAMVFFALGAPFVAALEVIVYAGAIMVLFAFVVMMLNVRTEPKESESPWLALRLWAGPALLGAVLLGELVCAIPLGMPGLMGAAAIPPREVGAALFGPYILGVELASILLLAGLVGAYHLGRRDAVSEPREEET